MKKKKESKLLKLLTESGLIIFSVLLALIISEWRNNYNEKVQSKKIIENIKKEIVENQKFLNTLITYHEQINKKIGLAYENDSLAKKLSSNNSFVIREIAPKGIMQGTLNDIAWTVAKTDQITNRIPLEESSVLYEVYEQQKIVNKTIQRIIDFLSSREVHRKSLLNENIIVFKTLFNELTGQEKKLNYNYQNAIEVLNEK